MSPRDRGLIALRILIYVQHRALRTFVVNKIANISKITPQLDRLPSGENQIWAYTRFRVSVKMLESIMVLTVAVGNPIFSAENR